MKRPVRPITRLLLGGFLIIVFVMLGIMAPAVLPASSAAIYNTDAPLAITVQQKAAVLGAQSLLTTLDSTHSIILLPITR
jgi:hypothetical protein